MADFQIDKCGGEGVKVFDTDIGRVFAREGGTAKFRDVGAGSAPWHDRMQSGFPRCGNHALRCP